MISVIPAATERPAASVTEFKERTAQKLHGVRCPDHGQGPRLKFHGSTLRDISIRMSGCCDKLLEVANRKIAGR